MNSWKAPYTLCVWNGRISVELLLFPKTKPGLSFGAKNLLFQRTFSQECNNSVCLRICCIM